MADDEREAFDTSAAAFFREAIEAGKSDERFGDAALQELVESLTSTAEEIQGDEPGDEPAKLDPAAHLLMYAAAAVSFLAGQCAQNNEVIEGLAVDLDAARATAKEGDRGNGER